MQKSTPSSFNCIPLAQQALTSNLMLDNVQKTFYAIVNVTLKPSSNSIIWHSHQQYNTRLWICTYWLETWMLLMNVIACLRSKMEKDYRYFYCFSLSTITLFNWPSSSSLPNIWEDNVILMLLHAWRHQNNKEHNDILMNVFLAIWLRVINIKRGQVGNPWKTLTI